MWGETSASLNDLWMNQQLCCCRDVVVILFLFACCFITFPGSKSPFSRHPLPPCTLCFTLKVATFSFSFPCFFLPVSPHVSFPTAAAAQCSQTCPAVTFLCPHGPKALQVPMNSFHKASWQALRSTWVQPHLWGLGCRCCPSVLQTQGMPAAGRGGHGTGARLRCRHSQVSWDSFSYCLALLPRLLC